MRLRRIQVPDFRVLKNVNIEFETDFVPQVFPLGSQNGGGKSTLLQLVFSLLHCSTKANREIFVKNIIEGFKLFEESEARTLAIIDILDKDRTFQLDFFACSDSYLHELLTQESPDGSINNSDFVDFSFSTLSEVEVAENRFSKIEEEQSVLREASNELKLIESLDDSRAQKREVDRIFGRLKKFRLFRSIRLGEASQLKTLQEQIKRSLLLLKSRYLEARDEIKHLSGISSEILNILASNNLTYILNYSPDGSQSENAALLCRIQGVDIKEAKSLLDSFSNKVFLAAPSTQIFLFLPKEARRFIFKDQKNSYLSAESYYFHLQQAKDDLPGLFPYDFLAVDLLVDSFKTARDRDFKEAIEKGEYGNHYKDLLNGLNFMLFNKRLNVKSDLSGVTLKMGEHDEGIEIYLEDLSHGELKRLSIYMWLIRQNIEDSIVLMDEIEIALHPDWQYKIVSELIRWAPTNQYILATHSYELCQAVTPAHVKELEPRLLKQLEQPA